MEFRRQSVINFMLKVKVISIDHCIYIHVLAINFKWCLVSSLPHKVLSIWPAQRVCTLVLSLSRCLLEKLRSTSPDATDIHITSIATAESSGNLHYAGFRFTNQIPFISSVSIKTEFYGVYITSIHFPTGKAQPLQSLTPASLTYIWSKNTKVPALQYYNKSSASSSVCEYAQHSRHGTSTALRASKPCQERQISGKRDNYQNDTIYESMCKLSIQKNLKDKNISVFSALCNL